VMTCASHHFASGSQRRFDRVIGADGLHSSVRALAFGDEARFVHFHDYYVAIFSVDNRLGLDRSSLMCSLPGRAGSLASARERERATAMLLFASSPLDYDRRDIEQHKAILRRVYAGMGWEVPHILEALRDADDLYFDAISHVAMDRYASGRVALLGDAAWGGTLGGQAAGLQWWARTCWPASSPAQRATTRARFFAIRSTCARTAKPVSAAACASGRCSPRAPGPAIGRAMSCTRR